MTPEREKALEAVAEAAKRLVIKEHPNLGEANELKGAIIALDALPAEPPSREGVLALRFDLADLKFAIERLTAAIREEKR